MKGFTFLSLPLLTLCLLGLLNSSVAFTAVTRSTNVVSTTSNTHRTPTHLHGWFDKKEEVVVVEAAEETTPVLTEEIECVPEEEELTESQRLLKKVKESGTAGFISYAAWELLFWAVSVPVCSFGFREATGHWPDFSNSDDLKALGAEAFAFVNFARLAVPLRIGLALSTTPWVEENIVKKFLKKDIDDENCIIPADEILD